MAKNFPVFSSKEIIALRSSRNEVDPNRPYSFLVEPEFSAKREVVEVATLFLTNNECPYHCLMCDLWKNTLKRNEASADVPTQIRFALRELPPASQIKLYNSGNFFDPKAVPIDQYQPIADLVKGFETVIVENHPNLCGDRCLQFRDLISPAKLEIALGLETSHPQLLETLNKGMALHDYERATSFLLSEKISMRTFILLKPPFLSEEQGIEWALRSVDYAFDQGVTCCSLVPTRAGNGIMEQLQLQGDFSPPQGKSIEIVLEEAIKKQRGRVFMDLWDSKKFFDCDACNEERISRLQKMNLSQEIVPRIQCAVCA